MKKWQSLLGSPSYQFGFLLLLGALAFGLRLAYLYLTDAWGTPPTEDGIEYHILGSNLANGKGYVTPQGDPYIFRPPGYPFFLAIVYRLFGPLPDVARMANVFLGALTCLPVYAFARRLWDWKVGLIAAAGIAVHPLLIYLTGLIYPESLTIFLIALSFYLTLAARQSSRVWPLLFLALTLAELIYLRPSFILWTLSLVVWVWVAFSTLRTRLKNAVIVIGGALILIAPWAVRNTLTFGEFSWMSTNGGVTFWASNNPLANGGWVEPGPETWQGADPPADLRGWPDLTPQESERRFQAQGMQWIRENPGAFLRLIPKKILRAFELSFGNESRNANLPAAAQWLYYGFLGISLLGLLASVRWWRDLLPLYLLIFTFLFSTALYYGSTRQTAALTPIMIIFAAKALVWLVERLRSSTPKKSRSVPSSV